MSGVRENLAGRVFQKLKALRPEYDEVRHHWVWVCECLLCGKERRVRGYLLLQEVYPNCGCVRTPSFARAGRIHSVEESLARRERVKTMREQGMSWASIGRKLGVSRQRAQQIGKEVCQ